MEAVKNFVFLGSKTTVGSDYSHEIIKDTCFLEGNL